DLASFYKAFSSSNRMTFELESFENVRLSADNVNKEISRIVDNTKIELLSDILANLEYVERFRIKSVIKTIESKSNLPRHFENAINQGHISCPDLYSDGEARCDASFLGGRCVYLRF